MAAADALVLLGVFLIVGFITWLLTTAIRKSSFAVIRETREQAARAEAAILEVKAYAQDHYVEPEVKVIGDILARHGY